MEIHRRSLNKVHAGLELILHLVEGGSALGTRGEVEASTGGNQVGIVGGGNHGDGAGTAGKRVAEVIGEGLQLVGLELVVIVDNVVVGGTAGSLDTFVGTKEEVKLARMADGCVDDCTSRDVAGTVSVLRLNHKKASVVTLLDKDEGNCWGIVGINLAAGGLDSGELELEGLSELALGDTVAVEKDAVGQDTGRAAELLDEAPGHALQVVDDLEAGALNPDG